MTQWRKEENLPIVSCSRPAPAGVTGGILDRDR